MRIWLELRIQFVVLEIQVNYFEESIIHTWERDYSGSWEVLSSLVLISCRKYRSTLAYRQPLRSRMILSLSQLSLGKRQGTPWTGRQSIAGLHRDKRDTQPCTLTLTPKHNLETPINLTCMFLDGGGKPEYLEVLTTTPPLLSCLFLKSFLKHTYCI